MTPAVHVIGAGMAGLGCAVALAKAGRRVVLHEAAGQAGGRCRSYHDDALDRRIDNGNHLMLSGNPVTICIFKNPRSDDPQEEVPLGTEVNFTLY